MIRKKFDPINYVNNLENAGCSREVAEAHAKEIANLYDEYAISNSDITLFSERIINTKNELLLKAGGMIVCASIVIIFFLIKIRW